MKTCKELSNNYKTVKEFIHKYKKELDILGGILSERNNVAKYNEYIKFVNTLSEDEYYANYISFINNDVSMDIINGILNDELDFNYYVKMVFKISIFSDEYDEKLYRKYKRELKKAQ